MGYNLSIKRIDTKIRKEEWIAYLNGDPEFELINDFTGDITSEVSVKATIPDSGLFRGEVPFVFRENYGDIIVKNPDLTIIVKMIEISEKLDASVVGEEEEVYDKSYIEKEKNTPPINLEDYKNLKIKLYNPDKKWWQFWKKGTRL